MARSEPAPSIADLLDEAASPNDHDAYPLKLDLYLASLEPAVAERVRSHLEGTMSARKIATIITNDPSTNFTISATAVGNWRDRYGVPQLSRGARAS